jgi:trigger factor
MQVTETKSEGLRREFKVVVPAADIERQLNTRLQELSRKVTMPGFRPGKVPLAVVRKRYASSVMGEVLERAVAESSNTAITERELQPAGQPKIEVTAFDEGRDLEYTLAVELLPKFEPMDFATLKLERLKAEMTDEKVDEALHGIAERHRRFGPLAQPRPAREGDQLVIDFEGKMNGAAFEGGTAKDWNLVLGASGFVPGFEDHLTGHTAGDEVTFDLRFPDDYGNRQMAGKTAVFHVKIKDIRAPAEVAVDDQLAKDLGLEDLAGLRKSVREQMEREYGALSRSRLKRAILDALAVAHDFEVPDGLVVAEFEAIWNRYHAEQAHDHDHGHDHDHSHDPGPAKAGDDTETEEERAECQAVAERRVRLGLLLGEVGRRNNVTVTPEELTRALYMEASRFPGQEKQVVEYFKRTPQALASLRAPLFEDKVVDFILELATVTERKVTAEELMKDPDEPTSTNDKPKAKARKKSKKD